MSESRGYDVLNVERTLEPFPERMTCTQKDEALRLCVLELSKRQRETDLGTQATEKGFQQALRYHAERLANLEHIARKLAGNAERDRRSDSFELSPEKKTREVLRGERDEWRRRALDAEAKVKTAQDEAARWLERLRDVEDRLELAQKALDGRKG